jgi:hypothetical protein
VESGDFQQLRSGFPQGHAMVKVASSSSVVQVQRRYRRPDNIKSSCVFHITHRLWKSVEVSFVSKQHRKPTFSLDKRPMLKDP